MTQETFINFARWKWFKITSYFTLIFIIWYLIDDPILPKSGSTFYGYSAGIISASIMVYLMWYGSRKRRYFASATTLREVLSAHVWLGLSLLILVPLHTGFRFNFNVHTMTAIFCLFTIITGVWGMYFYRTLPKQVKSNRGEGSLKNLLEQFENLGTQLKKLESGKSDSFISFISRFDTYKIPKLPQIIFGARAKPLSKQDTALALSGIGEAERKDILTAVSIIDKRFEFLSQIEHESLVQFWIKFWLYIHVPLACGSIILLIFHIVSVLYYGLPL